MASVLENSASVVENDTICMAANSLHRDSCLGQDLSPPAEDQKNPTDTGSVAIDDVARVAQSSSADRSSSPPPPPTRPPPKGRVVPPPPPKRPAHTTMQQGLGRFEGIVKSFNNQRGFGFIECAALQAQGFGDVFMHHTQMSDTWMQKDVTGSHVAFLAYLGNKGPQAKFVEFDDNALDNSGPPMKKVVTAEQKDLGYFIGAVKSFSTETGYGFISSAATRDKGYEGDVFVHKAQILNFEVGSAVRFSAYVDDKGRLKAKDLKPIKNRDSAFEVGTIEVTRQAVEAIAEGYLTLGAGAAVEVLYVGNAKNEDEAGWLYVKDCLCEHSGWLPSQMIATHPNATGLAPAAACAVPTPLSQPSGA